MDVPFLTFNAWVSVWLLVYCCSAAFFDLTRVVRLATRFTDEIFALLIVSIFVMDAMGDPFSPVGILRYFDPNHKSHGDYEDAEDYSYLEVALLSTLLGFGTTALIFFFRSFKFSAFFCNDTVRTSIHDFAVTLAVVTGAMVQGFLFEDVKTEQLNVPDQFEPTFQCCDDTCLTFFPDDCEGQEKAAGARAWFVDFSDLNGKGWVVIAAAGPAMLAFILVFLDNGYVHYFRDTTYRTFAPLLTLFKLIFWSYRITWHLINHKSHKIKHGEAYNYDLVLSGVFNFVNSCLGLPWLVATTVPCLIHLNALAEKDHDGKFVSVQETRLTMFFSHLGVGLSLLFLKALQLIPMPVLYGVFLFMGLSSLPGLQFWNRFLMFFQQPSKYPKTHYTKYMDKKQIHLYTVFQILFFGVVFTVMNFPSIAIVFPLMTLLCIPARLYFLPRFFEGWELMLMDGEDEQIQEWITAKEQSVSATTFGNIEHQDEENEEEM
jgi:hypothetical protein